MSTTEYFEITDPPTWEQLGALVGTENRIVVTLDDGSHVVVTDLKVIEKMENEIAQLEEEVASLTNDVDWLKEDLADWQNIEEESRTSVEEAARAFEQVAIRDRLRRVQ